MTPTSAPLVLLVEDDPDTRAIYGLILRTHGFHVVEAGDGREGVRLARELRPRVIIMNLVLPHVDGISAIERIRETDTTVPIITCTGFVHEDGAEVAHEAGCDVYLEKPCEPTRLVEEVKRFLDRVPAGAD